jgi:hypothetical protein
MTNASKRRVFYSSHSVRDACGAGHLRNISAVEGIAPAVLG